MVPGEDKKKKKKDDSDDDALAVCGVCGERMAIFRMALKNGGRSPSIGMAKRIPNG
jgi:hypothetical protein